MLSEPARVTRSGRISKQSPTTTTSRSRQCDSSSNLPNSRSNRGRKQTNIASTPSNPVREVATEELTAQGKERVRQLELEFEQATYIHRDCPFRRSHRGHPTSRSSSTSSTSSSEQEAFTREADHTYAGALCSSIHCRISIVAKIHIEKLHRGDLEARDILPLAKAYAAYISLSTEEIDGVAKLLRWVENYGQLLCHFSPPASEIKLQRALSCFRVKLLEHSETYNFCSVRLWCFCFIATHIIATRIKLGEDDPMEWMDGAPELQSMLVPIERFGGGANEQY